MKDLLTQLIRADSTADQGETGVAEVLARWFTRHGVDCQIDTWDIRRANVVAHVKTGAARPGLLFLCHLDVVGPGEEPWLHPPFEAVEAKGKIYGRGAVDMKGGMAAAAAALCEAVGAGRPLHGDIVFAATAGEETDSSGVQRFMEQHSRLPKFAGAIVPEPTDLSVVTAHRGLYWLRITTRGKAAHSSMPERGVNAITSMRRVLDALEQYQIPFTPHPQLGPSSLSVNAIQGGEAMNIIPDRCTIGVDIRTLPGQDHEHLRYDLERILAQLRTTVPQFDAELTVERSAEAMETDPECEFVQKFCTSVGVDLTNVIGFTTDAPHLRPLGIPIVLYGPGKPRLCHQVDEHLEIADLEAAAEAFRQAIVTFLT